MRIQYLCTLFAATVFAVLAVLMAVPMAWADQGDAGSTEEELARELQNPVAALISVPFQLNYDQNIGRDDD